MGINFCETDLGTFLYQKIERICSAGVRL